MCCHWRFASTSRVGSCFIQIKRLFDWPFPKIVPSAKRACCSGFSLFLSLILLAQLRKLPTCTSYRKTRLPPIALPIPGNGPCCRTQLAPGSDPEPKTSEVEMARYPTGDGGNAQCTTIQTHFIHIPNESEQRHSRESNRSATCLSQEHPNTHFQLCT